VVRLTLADILEKLYTFGSVISALLLLDEIRILHVDTEHSGRSGDSRWSDVDDSLKSFP
jgi:hypothetical protein